eukprot:scaffold10092_cov66-Phaeocystis_antarctica.AAC.5
MPLSRQTIRQSSKPRFITRNVILSGESTRVVSQVEHPRRVASHERVGAEHGHRGGACTLRHAHRLGGKLQARRVERTHLAIARAAVHLRVGSGGIGDFSRAFRPHHSLPRGPERLSGSPRVRSAAKSQESQPQEARAASCRTNKTVLSAWWLHARATNSECDRPAARQASLMGELPLGAQLVAVGRAPHAHRAVVARRQERAVGGERHRRNAVRMAQPMRGAAGEHRGRPGRGVTAPAAQRTVDAAGGEHAVAPPDA